MDSSPDSEFVPVWISDDEADDDTSSQPLRPLRRSSRLVSTGEDTPNTSQGHHSFLPEAAPGFGRGEDDPRGGQPHPRSLGTQQPKTTAALAFSLVEQTKIKPQSRSIALVDYSSSDDEADDAPPQTPRRSLRLRQAGIDAAHPWRTRRQNKLMSRQLAIRPQLAAQSIAQDEGPNPGQSPDQEIWRRMYAASHHSLRYGVCSLCSRTIHNITVHHVHPRVKKKRRGPVGFTEEQLGKSILICLSCHRIIHHIIPNQKMGMSYYSADMLRSHPKVMAWINWVTKQPLPDPVVEEPASRQNFRAGRLIRLRKELEEIWTENGNTFPKWWDEKTDKNKRHELVARLRNRAQTAVMVNIPTLQKAMKPVPKYREWYSWLFGGSDDANALNAPAAVASARNVVFGVDNIIADAMNVVSGAVEVIDLTGEVSGDDSNWIDLDANEEVQGKIVIDLTGDDSD